MYWLYSALLGLLLLMTLPYWLLQMMRHGKYRAGLRQRLGCVPPNLAASQDKPTIWLHAVSVGEVVASSAVVEALQQKFPNHSVVVSTTTATGQKLAAQRFGAENVFYFPLDFAFAIRPYLAALRPGLVVVAETEFWPNFLRLARRSGARIAVINCRISDRSFPGYQRFHFWLPAVLDNVDLFLAQTEEDRRRLIEIGAPGPRVSIGGNLKFDVAPPMPPAIVGSLRESLSQSGARPVLVCGSTLEDEEGSLLSAFHNILANHPKATMILAPRHPERFARVGELVESLGFRLWRRSLWSGESVAGGVLLVDTIGELAALYSLATVAFVGGSLVPRGGHNILEPALHGVPVVIGNHYENFRDIVDYFRSRNAVRVVGLAELPLVFMELIDSPEERETLGRNALAALDSQRGATARTVGALVQLMGKGSA
ncbi:MAG: 3-deoxy-D-manno-octulosonic acid transferase [Acidobacteriales bacterium]|nr:3-deoxy-D-manno-octulosonic acid transferase [Candidatus Koribacter versatilis]MBI3644779.1 3-deoxy-D-manno-octulosonic acid transferase [Terriglobales bacterium]